MPQYIPLSKKNEETTNLKTIQSLSMFADQVSCQITLAEAMSCVEDLPVAIIEDGNGSRILSVILGFLNKNALINENGHWIGKYIPALIRAYPFILAKNPKNEDQKILCYNSESKCLTGTKNTNTVSLFDANGEPTNKLKSILHFLKQLDNNLEKTKKAIRTIEKFDLLAEWPLTLELAKDKRTTVEGLWKINFEKFELIKSDDLFELKSSGALELIYLQRYSSRNILKLRKYLLGIEADKKSEIVSLRDATIHKQKKEKAEELDSLVKGLMVDD